MSFLQSGDTSETAKTADRSGSLWIWDQAQLVGASAENF